MRKKKKKSKRQPANRLKTGKRSKGNPAIVELGKATRFKPGESGNPLGRPRDVVSVSLRRLLAEPCPQYADGRTWAEAISVTICNLALRGNVHAAQEICDRTEGKPAQAISLSGGLEMHGYLTVEEINQRIMSLTDRARARIAAA